MLRSLYSGVSGMRNFQTKMDVIANNISNVNTTAFKSGRVKFQDMLNQSVASAQSPQAGGLGGVNPQQIGLGVKVGSIDTIMEGGAFQPTNRGLDFAIEGEGFFTLNDGKKDVYTRDGAFYVDYDGNLTNASGLKVMGYQNADTTNFTGAINNKATDKIGVLRIPEKIGTSELQEFNIDGTGLITGIYSDGTTSIEKKLGQISVTTFSNPSGLEKNGGNNYVRTNNSGTPSVGVAGAASKGFIRQGFLEMSNVDLANEFTEMIVTSRAYQANSRSITTSDEMIQELLNLKR